MKPFAIPFLKCTNCETLDNLTLKVSKSEKLDVDYDENFLSCKKHLFLENEGECIKMLEKALNIGYNYDSNDDISLYKFLFGNEIIEGNLSCNECGIVYPINDGIVNFLSPLETNITGNQ